MSDVANAREVALFIWVTVALILAVWYKPTRSSVWDVLKIVASPKMAAVFLLMAGYVTSVVLVLHFVFDLWSRGQTPETLLWIFGPGLVMLFSYTKIVNDSRFFRRAAISALGLTVVVEFLANLHPFHLVLELLLVPALLLLGGMQAMAGTKDEYKPAGKATQVAIALVGLVFLANGIVHIVGDSGSFTSRDNLRDLIAPVVLTVTFLPFVYFFCLWATYEQVFMRVGWKIHDDPKLAKYAKRKMVRAGGLRLRKVNWLATDLVHRLGGVRERAQVDELLEAQPSKTTSSG